MTEVGKTRVPREPVLKLPYDLLAYERWLSAHSAPSSPSSYLFLEPRVRFIPEPDDVLMLIDSVQIERKGRHAVLHHTPSGTRFPLEGLEPSLVERIVSQIDGKSSLFATQLKAKVTASQLDTFLRHTFGKLTLAAESIGHLESQLSSCGLIRFPGSPYGIERAYWANMIDVRTQIGSSFLREHDVTAFIQGLEALHVLALIGRSGRSFYRPSSPIVGKSGARAGTLYDVPTRTIRDLELTLFIDGPRVSSPFVGGRRYHEMLYRSLDDPGALDREREIRDEHALAWGQVTFGLARTDDDASHWFIPPRPLCHAHLEVLCANFNAALAESRQGTASPTTSLAAFHWAFIRLHPFACANQSIAMNLVNAQLKLRGRLPVPHLILDQLALRLTRAAHALAFERAVNEWTASPPASVPRAIHLMQQRAAMDRLLSQLDQAPSLAEAEKIAQNDPAGARLLLLR